MTILSATQWPNNSALISDCARLGYLGDDALTLDCTYGLGRWWNSYRPRRLITGDMVKPAQLRLNFTNLPFRDRQFDVVAYDPPYKLNGTPTDYVDDQYGVGTYTRWQDRMALMVRGQVECARVVRKGGFLLTKCMDQVVSGKVRFQSDVLTNVCPLEKVDELLFLTNPREQPHDRQVHSSRNYSTLMIYQRMS